MRRHVSLSLSPHQDGLEVPLQEVPEGGQEVDGRALDELALCAADLLLRLSTLDQSVSCTSQRFRPSEGGLCNSFT